MKKLAALLCAAALTLLAAAPTSMAGAPQMFCIGVGKNLVVGTPGDPFWADFIRDCRNRGGHPGPHDPGH